jgi:murein DD-endopeptidase MepM/ murein hydrolase activator NlpD
MADLSRNTLYKGAFASAQNIADTLGKIKQTPKVSPVQNVGANNGSRSVSVPQSLKDLGTITTGYKTDSTRYEKQHMGVDIANKEGTPIPSFSGGKVISATTGKSWTPDNPSYGNQLVIQDDQGNKYYYSHLFGEYKKVGDVVQPGEVIATMGGTGSTYSLKNSGPGIHLDLRIKNAADQYLDPFSVIK